ncbi:hypothetical protein [uncultured Massilia sp.]|uniref:hypothetical protein n=1 Tax=uncultured Massilia sp. TaxID=169973 RepID=UPI002588EC0A|nr:hypothetical protein [uncultured Massilia sp.]
MGENKGHGIKGPRHDDDVEDLNINASGGSQQQQQQGGLQSDQQQGSRQSGQGQQQGNQQSGGQRQGGQRASGGTPLLDDLGSRQGESAQDASQAWSNDNSIDKQRGNR